MKARALAIIREILDAIADPLSEEQQRNGWTEESQVAMRAFFLKLQQELSTGSLTERYVIVRGLDYWGVTSGRVFELSAELGVLLERIIADRVDKSPD